VLHSIVVADTQQTDTYFVVAHFHYVLFGGLVFGLFSGFYFWWPKAFGRILDERLGKLQFWLILIGFNLTFFPMHIVGLIGMPRRTYRYQPGMGWTALNFMETIGSFIIALGVLVFLVNIIYTNRKPRLPHSEVDDPWDGRSLEWSIPSPPPEYNFADIPHVEARDDWWHRKYTEDSEGRLVRLPSGGADDPAESGGELVEAGSGSGTGTGAAAATATTTAVATREEHGDTGHGIHMPSPSFYPLVVASGLPFLGYAAVFLNPWLAIPGLLLLLFGVYAWGLEPGTE
jgi:cytochrome c oxidase subunit 1